MSDNHHVFILGIVMAFAITGLVFTINSTSTGQVVGANSYGETYSNFGAKVADTQVQAGSINSGPKAYVCCETASLLKGGQTGCPTDNNDVISLCSLGQGVNGPEFKYSPCYAGELKCPLK